MTSIWVCVCEEIQQIGPSYTEPKSLFIGNFVPVELKFTTPHN